MYMRDDAYAKMLSRNLDRVLDLQKFAEAKNASLLAFASVWIVGLVNVITAARNAPGPVFAASVVALVLFMIAAMLAIASLLPRFISKAHEGAETSAPNMLFFGDIAKTTVATYVAEVHRLYFPEEGRHATDRLFDDLSRQIAAVSQISMRKYRLFNRAAAAALLGILSFIAPVVALAIDSLR